MGTRGRGLGTLGLVALAAIASPAGAPADSLYSGPAPRPGPDVLYRKPVTAPQLQNASLFDAKPILISGTSAYRQGEFLYQDFIYDDHGAQASTRAPNDPRSGTDSFSAPNGTYIYPTDPAYAGNAADLVELRVKPLAGTTAFRITLNTLTDPDLVGTTIAIGGDPAEPVPFPHGANAQAPAEYFLTVHGDEAELLPAAGGPPVTPPPNVTVSPIRNQITVTVPHQAWDPGTDTVRLAAGVGLWDPTAGRYLVPGTAATATTPGGAAGITSPTAFFNVAFRFQEPWPSLGDPGGTLSDPAWWRDRAQGEALTSGLAPSTGDLTPFHADVDFAKLASGERDDMLDQPTGVPTSGPMNRILSTRFDTGEGTDFTGSCTRPPSDCVGHYVGRLQPYAIYVPEGAEPRRGYGLTLLLHSLQAGYNQFSNSRNQSQLGERGPGSIVITPEARGPDGWYFGHAGADVFEVWADVARRYSLDPGWTAIAGYSMGGYGTYKLATQFPDLFARANPVVGPPGLGIWSPPSPPVPGGPASSTNRMLASVRHVPFLIWAGQNDTLVPVSGTTAQAETLDELGYRYAFHLFAGIGHLELAVNDQYAPAAGYLGTARVARNPAHVSYVVNPRMSFRRVGTVADHAYWLSGMRLRRTSGAAPLGEVDAFSDGFALRDPRPMPTTTGPGTLEGGNLGTLAYTETAKQWGLASPVRKRRNRLRLDATNLKRITVHVKRAGLSCRRLRLRIETDGPLAVRLAGCGRTVRFR
jgi:dienelactone hydrolase